MSNTNRLLLYIVLVLIGNFTYAQSNQYDCCRLAKSTSLDLNFISKNVRKILNTSDDNCVISLLDTLTYHTIRNGESKYFVCLDSIAKAGDGYVSEYFNEVGVEIFHNKFASFFDYLYNVQAKGERSALENVWIKSVSMHIASGNSKKDMEKRIDQFIDRQVKEHNFDAKQIQYLSKIRKRIDPEMFD